MKKTLSVLLVILCGGLTAFITVSCGYFQSAEMRSKTAEIYVGMSKEHVRDVLGEPLSKELFLSDNIWYYYTAPKWYDGQCTEDECSPFFFDEDELLIGWGQEYAKQHRVTMTWTQEAIDKAARYP